MKKLVAVCMALVMALGLAACGGSGSSSSAPAASSGAVSAPAASGTSASEADDGIAMTGGNVEEHSVEAIKAKGVLVVTTEAGYAPFEFLDENDNVVGLDASLAQALADDRSCFGAGLVRAAVHCAGRVQGRACVCSGPPAGGPSGKSGRSVRALREAKFRNRIDQAEPHILSGYAAPLLRLVLRSRRLNAFYAARQGKPRWGNRCFSLF